MEADNNIESFSIEDIFSDATLHAANKCYDQYVIDNPKCSMAQYLEDKVVRDEMDMINFRTGQTNDPVYISILLEWYLSGERLVQMCDGETEIPIDIIQSYVHLDHILHGEEEGDPSEIFKLYSEEMYLETFMSIMQQFIGD